MAEPLWRDGDTWRDLTDLVAAAGTATVVSQNGTTVLIDLDRRLYRRQPLEGGQVLLVDAEWLGFRTFSLTPCGLVISGAPWETWYWGTHVRLVMSGLRESLLRSDLGPDLLRQVMAGQAPCSPGHPASTCPAHHCVRRLTDVNDLKRENT